MKHQITAAHYTRKRFDRCIRTHRTQTEFFGVGGEPFCPMSPTARSARQIRESRRRAIRAAQPRKPLRMKAQGNALTLNTLRFASEIRSADELRLPVNERLVPNEVNLP
jgi:hypothetical protein